VRRSLSSAPDVLNAARLELGRLRALARRIQDPEGVRDGPAPGARVVCIASGKGGTGKSVMATNLALLRAARGERVCLIDFDAGLANAHLLLGLTPRYDLGHVLDGQVPAADALVESPWGFRLLSGGVGRDALANPTRRELDRLFRALQSLEADFDLVIVDHGAGLSYGTIAHLAATRTLLLVGGHEITALSDAYALYKRATLVNPDIHVGMVVNRAPGHDAALAAWARFEAAARRFLGHVPELVGWVPSDDAVVRSVEARRPVSDVLPDSAAALAIDGVARWARFDEPAAGPAFYERARRALR
jgi:flagellar biosynthesis protein FlhG